MSLTTQSSSATDVSSLVVAIDFTKKGDSSRKRKRSRQNRTQWKIAKLGKENDSLTKRNCALRVRVHRMKSQNKTSKGVETPRKSVNNLLRKNGLTPRKLSNEIKNFLLFSEALSEEIKECTTEKKNARQSIRRFLSGKILRKYKLLTYAAKKTGNDRRKMGRETSKVLRVTRNKRGFDPNVHKQVIEFYHRDDVSKSPSRKKTCEKRKSQAEKASQDTEKDS